MQSTELSPQRRVRPLPLAVAGIVVLLASAAAALVLAHGRWRVPRAGPTPSAAPAAATAPSASGAAETWTWTAALVPPDAQPVNTATDGGSFQMTQYASQWSLSQFLTYYRQQASTQRWRVEINQQATSAALRITVAGEVRPLEVTYSDSQHPNGPTGTHTISLIRRLIDSNPAAGDVPVFVEDPQQIAAHPTNYVVPEDVGQIVQSLAFQGHQPLRAAFPAANTPGIALYAIVIQQPPSDIPDQTMAYFKEALAAFPNVAIDNVNQLVREQSWSMSFHITGHGQVGTIHGSKAQDGSYQVLLFLPQK